MEDKRLDQVIAEALRIDVQQVKDDLSYGDVHEWDSLSHVELMLRLEADFQVAIGEDEMLELTSVRAIREFVGSRRQL